MVDMAVPYGNVPDETSDWADFRDAVVILCSMNQCLVHSAILAQERSHCAEQVLRVALFGRFTLPVFDLQERRKKVASTIRTRRRGGVVPILTGLLWFVFVLALSINFTFDDIGDSTAAHNLAMGLAVSWITPLVTGVVVERNPTATKDLRVKFNRFYREIRDWLRASEGKQTYLKQLAMMPGDDLMELRDDILQGLPDDLFVDFAGQGRLRWHRGVAHPVIAGIEHSFAAAHGRAWLDEGVHASKSLLVPFSRRGFNVVDYHLIVLALCAFGVIYGCLIAGFLISDFTPTVGLGCRSAGYLLFAILTLAAAVGEVCLEFLFVPASAFRKLAHVCLTTLEAINVCWLVFITVAQTFGVYQTCWCLSSAMDGRGG